MVADAAGDRLVVGSRRDGLTAGELLAAARRGATLFRARGVENVGMIDLNSEALPIASVRRVARRVAVRPGQLPVDRRQVERHRRPPGAGLVVAGDDFVEPLEPHDGIEVITTDDSR